MRPAPNSVPAANTPTRTSPDISRNQVSPRMVITSDAEHFARLNITYGPVENVGAWRGRVVPRRAQPHDEARGCGEHDRESTAADNRAAQPALLAPACGDARDRAFPARRIGAGVERGEIDPIRFRFHGGPLDVTRAARATRDAR